MCVVLTYVLMCNMYLGMYMCSYTRVYACTYVRVRAPVYVCISELCFCISVLVDCRHENTNKLIYFVIFLYEHACVYFVARFNHYRLFLINILRNVIF
jgi:hypothetical protein